MAGIEELNSQGAKKQSTQTTELTQVSGSDASGSNASGSGLPTYADANVPMTDYLYDQGIQVDPIVPGAGLKAVGLEQKGSYVINNHSAGSPSILINSGRVIINSKDSQTIIAGAEGVALTSPQKVNIDADQSVTIFGSDGVYLGIPNAGEPPTPLIILPGDPKFFKDGKKLKSYPSNDVPYEPMVLGLKLVNWLDDLLVVLKYNQILTPTGLGQAREDTQWDFIALQARLKELISTQVFVDGFSHEQPDYTSLPKVPDVVTPPQTSIDVNVNATITNPLTVPGPVTNPNMDKPGYYEATNPTPPALK